MMAARVLFLSLIAIVIGWMGSCHSFAEERPPSTPAEDVERIAEITSEWKLRLVPEKIPYIAESIIDKRWAVRSVPDIVGRSHERMIDVKLEQNKQLWITLASVQHFNVNQQKPPTKESKSYELKVGGPFMEFDGLLHTTFVDEDSFVPDAVIMANPNQWYTAAAVRTTDPDTKKTTTTVTEYLLELKDDPMLVERGRVDLHRHTRELNQQQGDLVDSDATFVVVRKIPTNHPRMKIQVAMPDARSLTLDLIPTRKFGQLREIKRSYSGIYAPAHPVSAR